MAASVGLMALYIAGLVLAFLNQIPFYPRLKPTAFSASPSPEFLGPLTQNNHLDSAEILWPQLKGPESIVIYNGYLYTGTLDGKVYRMKDNEIDTIVDWGCSEPKVKQCSRPMGMRLDKVTGDLYIADADLGLHKYNIHTKRLDVLFNASVAVNGKKSRLTDDLIVLSNGDVIFTDASTEWSFGEILMDFAESSPNGRIMLYSPRTKTTEVLLDQFHFPNGIELAPDGDFFIFAETGRFRILRYYLRGPEKGNWDVFADNLPGTPDNVRASGRGTYWIALVKPRLPGQPSLLESLGLYPNLRAYLTRLPYFLILPLGATDAIGLTNNALERARNYISKELTDIMVSKYGLIVELDKSGSVIRSLHSPDGGVDDISHVAEHDGMLYLGSPWKSGIRRLSLESGAKTHR